MFTDSLVENIQNTRFNMIQYNNIIDLLNNEPIVSFMLFLFLNVIRSIIIERKTIIEEYKYLTNNTSINN